MKSEELAEAFFVGISHSYTASQISEMAGRIRQLIAAEREACAKEADPRFGLRVFFSTTPEQRERRDLISEVCRKIAAAIRKRGQP